MNTVWTKLAAVIWRWDLGLCLICAWAFIYYPGIDLTVSSWFSQGHGFPAEYEPWIRVIYWFFAKIHFLLLLVYLIAMAWLWSRRKHFRYAKPWLRKLRFLLFAMILIPGLIVNLGLKDNSFGRPRPVHIQQFGGEMTFTPAFTYSGECRRNCSFVSGHAAMAFYFMSLGWLFRRRYLFVAGFALGCFIGSLRIVQGGHFLSDVVFSFWVSYFGLIVMNCFYGYHFKPVSPKERRIKPQALPGYSVP